MSSLYKRNGVWHVRVSFKSANGKTRYLRKSTGFTDQNAAEKVKDLITYAIINSAQDQIDGTPSITLGDTLNQFMLYTKSQQCSPSTITTYQNICRKIIGDVKATVYSLDPQQFLHTFKTRDLTEYAEKRSLENLKPASIALELKVLMAANRHAAIRLERKVNPTLSVKMPRPKPKRRIFSDDEIQTILRHCESSDPRMSDLFVFLLETGCRVSEIIRSQSVDYDVRQRIFNVHRSKTESSTRLYLSDACLSVLSKYAHKPVPFSGFTTVIKHLRLIITQVCNPPSRAALIARDGRATLHTTRHTFATKAAMAGISLHALSTVLGHTTPTMTAKYSHLDSLTASRSVSDELARLKHTNLYGEDSSRTKH